MLDNFISQNTGKVVSYDNVAAHAGQAIQLIASWCHFVGLPFQWANPADWWDDSDETFLEHWVKVVNDRNNADQLPKPGDIVIFDSSLPGSDHKGHASIFVENVGSNSWKGFDCNWGGKSAHIQSHNWSYVLGWFTPRKHGAFEGNPTPIADEAPSNSYDVTPIEKKSVTLKTNALLYNLNDVDWESFQQNPFNQGVAGTDVVIEAVAHHRLGGIYYMPDYTKAVGYRITDCDDHNGAELPPTPPEEHLTKPLKTDHLPKAPVLAPIKDALEIEKGIPRYASRGDAANGVNSTGMVPPGTYYPYKILEGMISLSEKVGKPMGWWIDPDDLLSDEEKLRKEWRTTYKPFRDQYGNIQPRYYAALNDDIIPDLEGKRRDLSILENQPILIRGWFRGPDSMWYGRPDDCVSRGELMWYGVRQNNLKRIADPTVTEDIDEPEMIIEPVPLPRFRDKLVSIVPPSVSRVFDIVKPK